MKTVIEMAKQAGFDVLLPSEEVFGRGGVYTGSDDEISKYLERFAELVRAEERAAIYDLVMEAPFKEFDRQEEDFDGEAANAMKAMAFSLTAAIRARSEK
jgi:hypothetical protein